MSFSIRSIPAIMRRRGWNNGAALMDRWFTYGAAIAPSYGPSDVHTIRMSTWALTFPRARLTYEQLMRERIWANERARREVAAMLRRKGLLTPVPQTRPFGNLAVPAPTLDADYVNYRVVSFGSSDLDDMSAALGNFTFRVAIAGGVAPTANGSRFSVTVGEVGVYIRDSYDFNGSQLLGFWNDKTNSVSMVNPLAGASVSNDDFRSWRAKNGKGCDFLVYSDVLRTRLPTPDVFEV